MKIAVVCGMSTEKVHARLLPLIELEEVDEIFLIRLEPIAMPKVKPIAPPNWLCSVLPLAEIFRFLSLIFICLIKNPDILFGIYFVPHGIYATIIGWIFRKPVIQELIGTDRLKVMRSKLLFTILESAYKIGVRGQRSRQQLVVRGIPEGKIFTPISVNALDFEHFRPLNCQKRYDFIYCGRMDQKKQIDILIRALAELRKSHPLVKAVFVGDGPERSNLEALSRSFDLQTTIVFVGNQPYEQIPKYLNQSRIFIMASAFEGLPVAMIEALSCGLPVVVPNVGDISDLALQGFNAMLIDHISMDSYIKVLNAMLSDDSLFNQLKDGVLETRQQLIQTYTLERARADFRQILLEIKK